MKFTDLTSLLYEICKFRPFGLSLLKSLAAVRRDSTVVYSPKSELFVVFECMFAHSTWFGVVFCGRHTWKTGNDIAFEEWVLRNYMVGPTAAPRSADTSSLPPDFISFNLICFVYVNGELSDFSNTKQLD
jgi:hypothetical protein